MSLLRKIGTTAGRHGAAALGDRETVGRRATIPPPTKGLNTRDPFAAMKPEYAITLDNFFPDHGAVRLRRGSSEYATGLGTGSVETLIEQYSGSEARFFGIGGGSVYDITNRGAAGTALKTGLTGSRWSWANGGGHIVMVNGEDDPERIATDGTFVAAHGWTGLTEVDELNTVTAFKNRFYFTRLSSPIVYYGPLNGVQGALTAFDLSYVASEGGNAIQIGTMTIDSGAGIDDLILVFMEHGIVLLYRGIDPSSAGADGFFLVGKFRIGELVGDRPLVNVGGDLFAHTVDGVTSMSELLKRGRSGQEGRWGLRRDRAVDPRAGRSVRRRRRLGFHLASADVLAAVQRAGLERRAVLHEHPDRCLVPVPRDGRTLLGPLRGQAVFRRAGRQGVPGGDRVCRCEYSHHGRCPDGLQLSRHPAGQAHHARPVGRRVQRRGQVCPRQHDGFRGGGGPGCAILHLLRPRHMGRGRVGRR